MYTEAASIIMNYKHTFFNVNYLPNVSVNESTAKQSRILVNINKKLKHADI